VDECRYLLEPQTAAEAALRHADGRGPIGLIVPASEASRKTAVGRRFSRATFRREIDFADCEPAIKQTPPTERRGLSSLAAAAHAAPRKRPDRKARRAPSFSAGDQSASAEGAYGALASVQPEGTADRRGPVVRRDDSACKNGPCAPEVSSFTLKTEPILRNPFPSTAVFKAAQVKLVAGEGR
jgi:hypothetical protein